MQSNIKTLLNTPDNSEIIRDQIAAILKAEFLKQKELSEIENIDNKLDFDINVYVENSRPWLLLNENTNKKHFPLVNVSLQEIRKDSGGVSGNIKYIATYNIDCWGCGNYQSENESEWVPDDNLAAKMAWTTARITRSILMSGFYVFLGLRNIVRKRDIESITAVIPKGLENSAIAILACRIIFKVDLHENSPEADGVLFNGISFKSTDNGEVIFIDIKSDNNKEKKE